MAELSFPLEGHVYSAEEAGLWFATRTSGVHASDSLPVSAPGGMVVNVGKGVAWLKYAEFTGAAYANTETKSMQISAADANLPRIDRVVVRYSKATNTIALAVSIGTPASTPTPPAVVRDSSTHEISLAQVRVNAGAAAITTSNITDERLNNAVCGLMSDGVTAHNPDADYAPGGFGLGASSSPYIADLNTANKNGWYAFGPEATNRPAQISYGMLFVVSRNANDLVQAATCTLTGQKAERRYHNGVFGEWEYVNPTLEKGVEYRTTERYAGKVVYTALVDCGTVTPGSRIDIDTNFVGNTVVRYAGVSEIYALPFINNTLDNTSTAWADVIVMSGKIRVRVKAGSEFGNRKAFVQVWYTREWIF